MREFAARLLDTYGAGAAKLPDWPNSDYETIYVFHVTRPAQRRQAAPDAGDPERGVDRHAEGHLPCEFFHTNASGSK